MNTVVVTKDRKALAVVWTALNPTAPELAPSLQRLEAAGLEAHFHGGIIPDSKLKELYGWVPEEK